MKVDPHRYERASIVPNMRDILVSNMIVDPNGCWVWQRTRINTGYGLITIQGNQVLVHRVMAIIEGKAKPDDPCVMHTCDNPACINPDHLIGGTHADNMNDKVVKGRVGTIPANHLRDRANHPKRRPVIAPDGTRYDSASLAAEAVGFSRNHVSLMARNETHGWKYAA